jgi:glyoxylase-like metal-dependent hydrolase (beta-lactamase superfamily II)
MTLLNIPEVNPLKEGDIIDLDGISLQVIEVPGHIKDHIAIFDEMNEILFTGDSLGVQFTVGAPYPNFMPLFWNKEDFYSSIEKMEKINFEGIALAHYGLLEGEPAQEYIKNLRIESQKWLTILERAEEEGSLDNIPYLVDLIFKETVLESENFNYDLFSQFIQWTTIGYKIYKGIV